MSLKNDKQGGMTLIEILIVLSILGCLSAIAIPSYQEYVYKAERKRAQTDLYQLQIWSEQEFTAHGEYPTELNCINCQLSDQYDFSISVNENGYNLIATPKSGSSQSNDKCYSLQLTHLSEQKSVNPNGTTNSNCW